MGKALWEWLLPWLHEQTVLPVGLEVAMGVSTTTSLLQPQHR